MAMPLVSMTGLGMGEIGRRLARPFNNAARQAVGAGIPPEDQVGLIDGKPPQAGYAGEGFPTLGDITGVQPLDYISWAYKPSSGKEIPKYLTEGIGGFPKNAEKFATRANTFAGDLQGDWLKNPKGMLGLVLPPDENRYIIPPVPHNPQLGPPRRTNTENLNQIRALRQLKGDIQRNLQDMPGGF